ncbi:MAG: hypothetical protein WAL69_15920, partial [Candidatus Acidiferrales bacterium]
RCAFLERRLQARLSRSGWFYGAGILPPAFLLTASAFAPLLGVVGALLAAPACPDAGRGATLRVALPL